MNANQLIQAKRRLMELGASGQTGAALDLAEKLCAQCPDDVELCYALAQLQAQKGMVEPAIQSYMRVVSRPSPVIRDALRRLVDLCLAHGYEKIALEPARHLARENSHSALAQYQLALCLSALDQLMEAKVCLLKVLALDEGFIPAIAKLADVCLNLGEVREAIDYFAQFAVKNGSPEAARHWCLNYLSGVSEQDIFAAHKQFAGIIERATTPATLPATSPEGRTLKVGLMSKDFCSHSVAWFIKPLLRSKGVCDWHLTAYSTGHKKDAVTAELQSLCDVWREASTMADEVLCTQIKSDEIDVLIDLVGYAGDARLSVFARRASPVQVTYLGYPNTTGLGQMDYRLTDEWSDPSGQTEAFYTEQLRRISGGFLCFEPHQDAPPVVVRQPGGPGDVVFGSFNVHHKISDEIFDCWVRVLKAIPASRMLLKSRPLADPAFCKHFLERFATNGIEPARIRLLGHTPGRQEHLALYNEVDINLDTYPYNGTTTTCEALWQGVPTLTLAGEGHRARVGCSIMNQIGLGDWVVHNADDYVARAIEKVDDLASLAALRSGMRERLSQSPLLDGERIVNELDQAFREWVQLASQS